MAKLKKGKLYMDSKTIRSFTSFLEFKYEENGISSFKAIGNTDYGISGSGFVEFTTVIAVSLHRVTKKDLIKYTQELNNKYL